MPRQAGYLPEQYELLYRRMFERLQQIPGVKGIAGMTYAPMSGDSWNDGIRIQGKPEPHSGEDDGATWTRVTPEYFSTLDNHIARGPRNRQTRHRRRSAGRRRQRSFRSEIS